MPAIVFDQYQRYLFIQRLISALSQKDSDRILEVGAFGSPLPALIKDRRLVLVDQCTDQGGLDVRADGLHLPFLDRAFEIVICTDTLEHMTSEQRIPFLTELARVTSSILVVGFPHANSKNEQADRIVFEFIRKYSGIDSPYLEEHTQFGLPDAEEIRHHLEAFMPEVFTFENSNVNSWLLLQLGNYALLQRPEMDHVRSLLNKFFNDSLESTSHDPPCYRTFLVCSREILSVDLKRQMEKEWTLVREKFLAQNYSTQTLALISASEAAIQNLRKEADQLEQNVNQKIDKIRDQAQQIDQLKSRVLHQSRVNHDLKNYLDLFLQHPVYKIFKFVKNYFGQFSKNGNFSTGRKGLKASYASDPLEVGPEQNNDYLLFQATFEPRAFDLQWQASECQHWDLRPAFSIVTAVFDPSPDIFQQTITSVLQQTYDSWTWNVVDSSTDETCWRILIDLAKRDSRVKPHRLDTNNGISENLNTALHQSTGDYVVFLDHDDTLAPQALFEVARAIISEPDLDFIYSDSDKLDETGQRCDPIFKPGWSPEMMLCCNILNQISVFRRSLLDETGYLNPQLDGAQDWDLYLRITEKTQRIHHIPQILYHWRKTRRSTAQSKSNKPYASDAQIRAITGHLQRTGISNPEVRFLPYHPINKIYPVSRWPLSRVWKVSIIIPSKDRIDLLKKCLDSVFRLTQYPNYEVIIVDTGSIDQQTFHYYEELKNNPKVVFVSCTEVFNFGKACNAGAARAVGDMLLFLNNDTELLEGNWLQFMLQWFERQGIGAVGAKLLYPSGKIQHAGVVLGFGGLAAHLFVDEYENTWTIFGSDAWYRNVSAVTGACLMIPSELFKRINGFDESFQLNFSDIQLCLKVRELGYRIVYTPEARLTHVESASHNRKIPRLDFENATKKWKSVLEQGDPYYNPNLTMTNTYPSLKHRAESVVQLNQEFMKRLPRKEIIVIPDDIA